MKSLAKPAVALSAVVAALIPLELGLRSWVERHGDPVERAWTVLRADPRLGWRQREGFHGRFYGASLDTNEIGLRDRPLARAAASPGTIVVMGPSSAFGWGVPEEATYARTLERLLSADRPSAPPAVVNAGEIGFSSWQGLRFYREEIERLKPAVLILAYGVNDVDRYRFFFDDPRPDDEALGGGGLERGAAAQNAMGGLSLLRRARRGAANLRLELGCYLPAALGGGPLPLHAVRVSRDGFSENLRSFAELAGKDGAKVVLLTTPFHYPRFPPGADTNQCEARYARSAALAAEGRCAQARREFEEARRLEPMRIERDLRAYNDAVREFARAERLPLVDAEALFARGDPKELLVDPIHPSPKGHALIARALAERMRESKMIK